RCVSWSGQHQLNPCPPRAPRLSERRTLRHAGDSPQRRRTLARLLRLERFRNALGTAGSYAAGVNLGLPATAAIVDMPVGTPLPCICPGAGSRRCAKSGARPGSTATVFLLSKRAASFPAITTDEEEF